MSESERPKPPPAAATTTKLEPASAGAAPTHDLTGRALGDFRVERRLGQGGMGEVYLAHQVSLDRKVALKVLRPDLLTNPTVLSRFEAEATAVAKLNHPNIVHVYTLGDVDDLRYIAMEYVPGMNLREFLNRKGPPDLPQALAFMKQAALAIAAAGEVGLIHRDIKPENLLLNRKGQLKVADFGLCREQGDETLHLTQPGVTLGTPLYMSPEQVQGQPLDHRSDLYSLGVTFYHLLAGFP
ncbi:MAG TPA: serine/threonine-protein kinase, partial [Isosphaeraceae bacterium]